MKLRLGTSFIALMMCVSSLYAQAQAPGPTSLPSPQLKGKVFRVDSRDNSGRRGGEIRITVKDRDTRRTIKGEQPATRIEDWYHVAPLAAFVDIEFDGGPCYVPDGHSSIRVQKVNPDLDTVKLQKTRECQIIESHQQRKEKGRTASVSLGSATANSASPERAGAAPAIDHVVVLGDISESGSMASRSVDTMRIDPVLDADLIPTPAVLRRELETEAARARIGEFFDTFQYNFALKSELYSDRPELVKVLSEFRGKLENGDLFQQIGKLEPEMFNDVVRREFQTSNEVNLDNIRMVIKEESASQSIRGSATVALLNGTLDDAFLKDMRGYYREQTSSSPIFSSSLIALGRIGQDQDKARLYNYVKDSSGNDRLSAMEALAAAQLIEGPGALPEGAKTLAFVANEDDDPEMRAFAVHSLRPFVYQQDQTAIMALFNGLQDRDPRVRAQAALALGVGRVERQSRVRDILLRHLRSDRSPLVRNAARLSLAGFKTAGLFLVVPGTNSAK